MPATLIVPVILGVDERANELLTWVACSTPATIPEEMRAGDTDTIERLADSRVRTILGRSQRRPTAPVPDL